jgi:hypothetical protein
MPVVFHHHDADLTVEDYGTSRVVSVEPHETRFVPFKTCVTSYSIDEIQNIFAQKGAWAVDQIVRNENSNYMRELYWELLERGITRR